MISEQEAQDLVFELKELQEKSKKDPSVIRKLRSHESICISKLKYLITMKLGRYKNFSNYEDLYQEGCEALLKAIKTYDPSKGSVFWWFHKYIDTRISRSANLHTTIRYPLKVAKEQTPHKECIMPNLVEENNCPHKQLELMQNKQMIEETMKYLSNKQRQIITMAFGIDGDKPCSTNKIARRAKISRTSVLRELRSAICILKENIKQ
jgi:RNA polymerase sporulation-specific sigma factor